MDENVVMLVAGIMFFLMLFFIAFFISWNRKSVNYHRQIADAKDKKQKDLMKAMIKGQEEERARLSTEFHDSVGPLLASINLKSRRVHEGEQAKKDFQETITQTISEIRHLSKEMSPRNLNTYGLQKAVKFYIEGIADYCDLHIKYQWDPEIERRLSEAASLNIFRIIQEALTNIIRHANAELVHIHGALNQHLITIQVQDDGEGFDEDVESDGIGIKNMRARADAMNADLTIDGTGNGTTITLKLKSEHND